jgi:hypothetical protein
LCRVFIQDADELRRLFKILSLTLVPLAVLMLLEKVTAQSYFHAGITVRDGHIRATGPFAHPILAGTLGAVCVPMALSIWRTNRVIAVIGLCAALGIVASSTSSGPIMMLGFICVGLMLWKIRSTLPLIRWGAVAAIVALEIVMNDPVYFLLARIDLTGSSTGWYRAQLIRSSIEHYGEWWLVGTDYTRHWMPSGIHANDTSADLTNHFLQMGVWGGVPLQIVFAAVLLTAFLYVGRAVREQEGRSTRRGFFCWTIGAILFGYVVNFWGISLFDQSVSFFYLTLAGIGAIHQPVAGVARERLLVRTGQSVDCWASRRPMPSSRAGTDDQQGWKAGLTGGTISTIRSSRQTG